MTREEWLNAALAECRAKLATVGCIVPEDARVSFGFPGGGSKRTAIGQCWTRAMSSIGVNEMFISPTLTQPFSMVDTLLHEAIHASDDCASGHKGAFKRAALAVGMTGKMTSTVAGPELAEWITACLARLPAIDHGSLRAGGIKKQSTRMLKFECTECGCTVRASSKWADTVGATQCACGGNFQASV